MKNKIVIISCGILLTSSLVGCTNTNTAQINQKQNSSYQKTKQPATEIQDNTIKIKEAIHCAQEEAQLIATELQQKGIHIIDSIKEIDDDHHLKTIEMQAGGITYYLTVENGFLQDIREYSEIGKIM